MDYKFSRGKCRRSYGNIIALIFCITAATALRAQSPTGIYYLDSGFVTEKVLYDSKERQTGIQQYSVNETHRSGSSLTAVGNNIQIKNGKESEATQCDYSFDGSVLWIAMGRSNDGGKVSIDYPVDTSAELKYTDNIEFSITARLAGINKNVNCRIDNRRILARGEEVATPCGTWNCVKSGYDMELKCFGIAYRVYVIEWFAPGTGIVRTDIYRKDKLHERRLLNGFRSVA